MNTLTLPALPIAASAAATRRHWSLIQRLLCVFLASAFFMPVLKAQDKDETELEKVMDKMNGAFKKLRRQVADSSKNAESLKLVATIKAASNDALKLTPALAAEQPADKRDAFIAAYKKKMHEFLAAVEPVEAALKAGKNDEAEALVKTLAGLQKEGHADFKKKSKS